VADNGYLVEHHTETKPTAPGVKRIIIDKPLSPLASKDLKIFCKKLLKCVKKSNFIFMTLVR
jgi:hypothetical protein